MLSAAYHSLSCRRPVSVSAVAGAMPPNWCNASQLVQCLPTGAVPPNWYNASQLVKCLPIDKSYTIVCSRPEDGLRCRQGVKPPLKLKTQLGQCLPTGAIPPSRCTANNYCLLVSSHCWITLLYCVFQDFDYCTNCYIFLMV